MGRGGGNEGKPEGRVFPAEGPVQAEALRAKGTEHGPQQPEYAKGSRREG